MRSAGKVTDLPSVISVNQTIKSSEPPWTHFHRTQIDTAQGGRVRSVTVVHRGVITKSMKMKTKTMGPPRRRLCLILPVAAGLDPSEILLPL